MAEQQRRLIVNWHRGASRSIAYVAEVAAILGRPKPPPSDIDIALESARLNLCRPPIIIDQSEKRDV